MPPTTPELKNIHAIMALERQTREERTRLDQLADAVANAASRPVFILLHLVWFAAWIGFNVGTDGFDPFPFSFLTLVVSLEAIVLTGFVMVSQAQMTEQADRRAHLDLQVNLLAEQELTAILKLQCLLAERAGVDVAACDPKLYSLTQQLLRQTDVQEIATALKDELGGVQGGTRPMAKKA